MEITKLGTFKLTEKKIHKNANKILFIIEIVWKYSWGELSHPVTVDYSTLNKDNNSYTLQ